jgi:hypothetical protein
MLLTCPQKMLKHKIAIFLCVGRVNPFQYLLWLIYLWVLRSDFIFHLSCNVNIAICSFIQLTVVMNYATGQWFLNIRCTLSIHSAILPTISNRFFACQWIFKNLLLYIFLFQFTSPTLILILLDILVFYLKLIATGTLFNQINIFFTIPIIILELLIPIFFPVCLVYIWAHVSWLKISNYSHWGWTRRNKMTLLLHTSLLFKTLRSKFNF